jgi:hypothetical protein
MRHKAACVGSKPSRVMAATGLVVERLAKESLGGIHVAPAAEIGFHRAALLVHRSVQVHPLAATLK